MKKIAITLLAGLLFAPPMFTVAATQAGAQTATVTVAPEDRTRIKKYVTDNRVKKVTVKERKVGSKIPADVELVSVPSDWGPTYSKYRYVYSDDDVLLVDPGTREVVYVID